MNTEREIDDRLADEAQSLLESEMQKQAGYSYQDLLAHKGKLRERESQTASGRWLAVCTQVLQANDLECTLEVRGSVHLVLESEVIPLQLRACLKVTPDDQRLRL